MSGKIKNIIAVLFSITLVSLLFSGYLLYSNQQKADIIKTQEHLLKKNSNNDKSYVDSAKKITDSIKHIASQITYTINGKSYSSDEFIDKYLQMSHEKDRYMTMYEMAKKEYGFIINSSINKSDISYKWGAFSRADSAQLTFELFRNRIRKNSRGEWIYDNTSKKDIEEIDKKLRKEVMPLAREILKGSTDTSKKTN